MLRLAGEWVWDSCIVDDGLTPARASATRDRRWYRAIDEDRRRSETWRDPFVLRDPAGDGWHVPICARVPTAPRNEDGVLAHARSADLLHRDPGPPLTAPAGFGRLEVPQVRQVEGRWLPVFTCHPEEQSAERRARYGDFTTWVVAGDGPLGPWDFAFEIVDPIRVRLDDDGDGLTLRSEAGP